MVAHAIGIGFSFWLYYYDGTKDHAITHYIDRNHGNVNTTDTLYNKWVNDIKYHQPKIKAYKILKEKTLYDASVISAPFGIYYGIVIAYKMGLSNIVRVMRIK